MWIGWKMGETFPVPVDGVYEGKMAMGRERGVGGTG